MEAIDYPAAHSMDTSWWGVDEAGEIAEFDSGEAGAVPIAALWKGPSRVEICAALNSATAPAGRKLTLERLIKGAKTEKEALEWYRRRWWNDPTRSMSRLILLVPSAAAARELLAELEPIIEKGFERPAALFLADAIAIFTPYIHYGTLEELRRRGLATDFWCHVEFTDPMLGIYTFEHDDNDMVARPYDRKSAPTNPLRLEELPEEMRAALALCRFEGIRFDRDEFVQPVGRFACAKWGGLWLDESRTLRPFPEESGKLEWSERIADKAREKGWTLGEDSGPAIPQPKGWKDPYG